MVTTGFKACIGSWKMHAISEPRTFCSSGSGSFTRSTGVSPSPAP